MITRQEMDRLANAHVFDASYDWQVQREQQIRSGFVYVYVLRRYGDGARTIGSAPMPDPTGMLNDGRHTDPEFGIEINANASVGPTAVALNNCMVPDGYGLDLIAFEVPPSGVEYNMNIAREYADGLRSKEGV